MNMRENMLSLYRREGYEKAPAGFNLCPSKIEEFQRKHPEAESYQDYFEFPYRIVVDPGFGWAFENNGLLPERNVDWNEFYPEGFSHRVDFDIWGVAHEENPNSMHMTQMHHPMQDFDSVEQIENYPWPDFTGVDFEQFADSCRNIRSRGLAVFVWMECTIWETAWYIRGMDNLMLDMTMGDPKASRLLDIITEKACYRAEKFAAMDSDILGLGDDIGMQNTTIMSPEMYRQWLQPRLKKVIDAAKSVNPDILISYHSCGKATGLIPELIEAGIDILNPVQPECMDFEKVHADFGDKISFNGTIGTQQLMPFGTPQEVKDQVKKNLDIAGQKGGLFCCPSHVIEPEVPWENIEAYVEACREYK
ncbi:uroporphyrinogen decarboxylase family protein [Sedimentisphaera salicampi]|uniref:uroporphyrinogen decarboxylase family protein n=1 Tax=Sedimentisphaera salicampi TaxID=1941349 RepID=UPI000B9BE523|nr:uroporphyrinogen decarboxylase family protein [Sedimentisphaera salicampi]OXU15427.1 methylcobalamin:coenzyme M methyltransferase [Sedimentisphaera salicampi]